MIGWFKKNYSHHAKENKKKTGFSLAHDWMIEASTASLCKVESLLNHFEWNMHIKYLMSQLQVYIKTTSEYQCQEGHTSIFVGSSVLTFLACAQLHMPKYAWLGVQTHAAVVGESKLFKLDSCTWRVQYLFTYVQYFLTNILILTWLVLTCSYYPPVLNSSCFRSAHLILTPAWNLTPHLLLILSTSCSPGLPTLEPVLRAYLFAAPFVQFHYISASSPVCWFHIYPSSLLL